MRGTKDALAPDALPARLRDAAPPASRPTCAAPASTPTGRPRPSPANVRQYDPGLHLWSDGASKTRWIYLPPGTKIDTSNMDEWTFARAPKVWKEFVVGGVRLETRLLWKRPSGAWYFTTYRWSADGSAAPELTAGELNADGNGYEIPTQSACYDCHSGRMRPRARVRGGGAVVAAGVRRDDGDPHGRQPPHRPAVEPDHHPRRRRRPPRRSATCT